METVDVLVVGAGLAGLETARLLARQGLDVLVRERRSSLDVGIRTTGIFVRRTLEDFAPPRRHLGPAVRRVLLYPPSLRAPVELVSPRDEFRVADMAGVYAEALARATRAGARVRLGAPHPSPGVRARFTIGADGARSTVARELGLDVNRRLTTGVEEVFPVATASTPAFHCVLDPDLAPGYLAWLVDDGHHAHLGLAGLPPRLAAAPPAALVPRRVPGRARARGPGAPPRRPDPRGRCAAPDRLPGRVARRRRGGGGVTPDGGRPGPVPAHGGAGRDRHRGLPAHR
ncbi:NAD(P)/FAD-dependent oxidoreductase [Saccharothrix xinjiangensis]|uniref:NAD(P)/FAD-dependent oxidoreductase n=1 Tax=Saccharothrix xinjiangensis TaxID=204798 RepID=A0ABV9Y3Z4_9PSEU